MTSLPYGTSYDEPSLRVFIGNINCHHSAIKFTALWSAEEVTLLDTRVYLRDSQIGTDLHVKPPDTHQYLRMDSCDPQHCKSSIPYSQALHLQWNCSEDEHLQKWTHELKKQLLKWRYHKRQLNKEIDQVLTISRENCLQIHSNHEVCSNTAGGHIPSNFATFSSDRQAPPFYSSYLRTAIQKAVSLPPLNSFPPAEKFKGSLDMSASDCYKSRATWQPSLRSCTL